MSTAALAPFSVRSFRFQWPADLVTSWAFEMETLILGWYVLVETRSVLLLTLFGSLQFAGTLLAPMFGVASDRIGHRNLLCAMRASYGVLAGALMTLAFAAALRPVHVLVIAALSGLIRPSDLAMRNALVGATMPAGALMGAMSLARMTQDSARTVAPLAGAGLFAALGMGPAYLAVTSLYLASFLLTLGVSGGRFGPPAGSAAAPRRSIWRDLRDGVAYVGSTPSTVAAMWLAFLVNLTAFPLSGGLLPYVAKEIYHIDQTGLGYLIASFAIGSLCGSIVLSLAGRAIRPARMMLVFVILWYAMLLLFARMEHPFGGVAALVLAGFMQSLGLVPMSVLLLRTADEQFRGRVMGVRMLAIYGVPLGLLGAGGLIDRIGFAATATTYCVAGIAVTLAIALRWRTVLWPLDAPANAR